MNKAKITYRFDERNRRTPQKEQGTVIPLTSDEFSIVEEGFSSRKERAGEADDEMFRAGGARHREKEMRSVADTLSFHPFTTDFGAWQSPFDAETKRVEQLIRESGRASPPDPAPADDPHSGERDDRFDGETGYYWAAERGTPPDRRDDWQPPLSVAGSRFERYHRTPWLKIVTSVTGAVATGVVIGFFVLSMFGGDSGQSGMDARPVTPATDTAVGRTGPSGAAQTNSPNAVDVSGTKADAAAPASTPASGTVSVNLPAQSYTLLQNGVFTNRQGADAAVAELRKKGLAGIVQPADKFYVFAGIAPSRDDALALSQLLQEQKMELFLKTLTVPAVAKVKWSGRQADQVGVYFAQGNKLVETIGGFTMKQLKQKTPGPMDDGTMQTIRTAHQGWSGAGAPFGEGLPQEQQAVLQKMGSAMNTAVSSMEEYKKNPSASFLWQAQTSLMQYLFAQNELLAAVSAP